jgi:hypothetical protein
MKTSYSLMLLSSKYKNPMNIQLDQKATQIPRNPNLAKRAKKKKKNHYLKNTKIKIKISQ